MIAIYLLIRCELGSEKEIIEKIAAIPQTREVKGTFGVYDIFAKIESSSQDDLDELMTNKIRKIDHIQSTNTLTVIESQGGL